MNLLMTLIVGAIAGWLGSLIFRGSGFGLIGNIIIGILGSFVGSWALGLLNFSFGAGILGAILTGAVGAIVILAVANLLFGGRK
jgi:uncharacterized membrane protein YeaQ/YmgE (transglycosylase-associated protein family)